MSASFPMLGKFSVIISSDIFSGPFSSPSHMPIIQMLVHLKLSQSSLRLSLFLFNLFSLFSSMSMLSTSLSSTSLICFPAPNILQLVPFSEFFLFQLLYFEALLA